MKNNVFNFKKLSLIAMLLACFATSPFSVLQAHGIVRAHNNEDATFFYKSNRDPLRKQDFLTIPHKLIEPIKKNFALNMRVSKANTEDLFSMKLYKETPDYNPPTFHHEAEDKEYGISYDWCDLTEIFKDKVDFFCFIVDEFKKDKNVMPIKYHLTKVHYELDLAQYWFKNGENNPTNQKYCEKIQSALNILDNENTTMKARNQQFRDCNRLIIQLWNKACDTNDLDELKNIRKQLEDQHTIVDTYPPDSWLYIDYQECQQNIDKIIKYVEDRKEARDGLAAGFEQDDKEMKKVNEEYENAYIKEMMYIQEKEEEKRIRQTNMKDLPKTGIVNDIIKKLTEDKERIAKENKEKEENKIKEENEKKENEKERLEKEKQEKEKKETKEELEKKEIEKKEIERKNKEESAKTEKLKKEKKAELDEQKKNVEEERIKNEQELYEKEKQEKLVPQSFFSKHHIGTIGTASAVGLAALFATSLVIIHYVAQKDISLMAPGYWRSLVEKAKILDAQIKNNMTTITVISVIAFAVLVGGSLFADKYYDAKK